jgi:hypothetical protein
LEEMEQFIGLFYAPAESARPTASTNPAVVKVLRVFKTHALILLQQHNYALTHPNYIASLLAISVFNVYLNGRPALQPFFSTTYPFTIYLGVRDGLRILNLRELDKKMKRIVVGEAGQGVSCLAVQVRVFGTPFTSIPILTRKAGKTQNYGIYKRMLFDENYGLAATQSLKNKDYFAFVRDFLCSLGCCFTRYPPVFEHHPDAASRSIKECLVDLYGKPELLFFGPDGRIARPIYHGEVTDISYRGYSRHDGLGGIARSWRRDMVEDVHYYLWNDVIVYSSK